MTRSVEIPEAAVEAAYGALTGDIDKAKVRAVLEAALPYLAPAGDGGLREALEQLCTRLWTDAANNGTDIRHPRVVLENRARNVESILAAHPAAPAVPQPVDREALERVIEETFDEMERDFGDEGPPMETLIGQLAGNVLAVLAGEQEQVEK